MLSKFWYKLLFWLVKHVPIGMAICSFIHMLLTLFGIDCIILSCIGGVSILPFLMLIATSFLLKFCFVHRLPLYYSLISCILGTIDYYVFIPNVFIVWLFITFIFIVVYTYLHIKASTK